jgi:quercetin dioxygenase-like cupin family protein
MTSTGFFDTADLSQGIARTLAEGLTSRVFVGEQIMISVVRIEPRARGAVHSHPEEQWGFLVEGSGTRTQEGVDHPVSVGHLWYTPGGVPHGFVAGENGAVILDIFSPPRPEYLKAGAGFGG